MKLIPLSRGLFAIVDDEDHDWLSQWKWCAVKGWNGSFYAGRNVVKGGKKRTELMHRVIMNANEDDEIDHIHGLTLDNRKSQLRTATRTENSQNSQRRRDNTSGFKGVSWHRIGRKWKAEITIDRRYRFIGLFASKVEAANAYDDAAIEAFGNFAKLNFPVIYG